MNQEMLIVSTQSDIEAIIKKSVAAGVTEALKRSLEELMPKQPFSEYPFYVTKTQATEMTQASLVSIGNWLRSGKLKKYKIDGMVRIKRDDITKLVEDGLVKTYQKA